jgi:hypothetical protein
MRELIRNTQIVPMLINQTINNTDTATALVDLAGFNGLMVAVSCGNFTGLDADSTLEMFLEESDSRAAASFTRVAVNELVRDDPHPQTGAALSSAVTPGLFGTLNADAEDSTVYRVQYLGVKRYVRVVLDFTTGTGGITAAPVSVMGILHGALHNPPAGVVAPTPAT